MKQTLSYNIHDILKFKITRDRGHGLRDLINLKFSFFEVEAIDNPDITLNIGKFAPSNEKCYLVDHKYYIKENYLYCSESEGKGRWELEIKGVEDDNVIINFDGGITGIQSLINRDFIAQILLLNIIEYKLAQRGYFLLHAAGVSKDGQAYIFAGRGGTFKTSICLDLVRRAGFSLLGDDHVILHEREVLSFPTSPRVLDFMFRYLPDENSWNFLNKLRFAKYIWSKRKKEVMEDIIVRISEPSKLKRLFFIVRTNKKEMSKRELSLEEATAKFITNNELEYFISLSRMGINSAPFLRYMLAYSFVFPRSSVASLQSVQKRKVEALLSSIAPIYEVEVPAHYSGATFNQILRLLDLGWRVV